MGCIKVSRLETPIYCDEALTFIHSIIVYYLLLLFTLFYMGK